MEECYIEVAVYMYCFHVWPIFIGDLHPEWDYSFMFHRFQYRSFSKFDFCDSQFQIVVPIICLNEIVAILVLKLETFSCGRSSRRR